MYTGYLLSEKSRNELLKLFIPKYDRVYAHHITYEFSNFAKVPPKASIEVIGYLNTTDLELLVVGVNSTIFRPDAGIFHITWSLDYNKGRRPVDSNQFLVPCIWEELDKSIEIIAVPEIFLY